jgi:hypothetical protein
MIKDDAKGGQEVDEPEPTDPFGSVSLRVGRKVTAGTRGLGRCELAKRLLDEVGLVPRVMFLLGRNWLLSCVVER